MTWKEFMAKSIAVFLTMALCVALLEGCIFIARMLRGMF